jgi:hypothetical protein
MADLLVNDKGANETDPWPGGMGIFAVTTDVQSWARVLKSVRESVQGVLKSSPGLPNAGEAEVWVEETEKYSDLANPGLGFGALFDFGPFDALDQNALVMETIANAKEGQRLLGVIRSQAGVEGGEDVGGTENVDSKHIKPESDASMFIGGAVVAGLVGAAYWFTRKS